jgi:hypothetical protein
MADTTLLLADVEVGMSVVYSRYKMLEDFTLTEHYFQDAFKKNDSRTGSGAHVRKETTFRVMVASRPKVGF